MRTVIAMIFALVAAGFTALSVAHNVADNIVAGQHFTMPGEAARAHTLIYMGTNFMALVLGYGVGWLLAYPLRRRPQGQ
ncbi:MAG: hypothetical protein R3D51_09820 [Hyphomicrobiaceae bacterium]